MKKIFIILSLAAFFLMMAGEANAGRGPKGHFYHALKHHGRWIEMNDGFVVWQPRVMQRSWLPYSEGEWIWTSNGWYWESYEPYGYIVYHYGRWHFDDYYGWIWVPDDQWGPAWVEWRYDDDYIGWAPMSPYALFSINLGIHFSRSYNVPHHHWHFVNYNNFCSPGVNKYYVGHNERERIYGRTKYRTEYDYRGGSVYNRGVDPDDIRRRTKSDIRTRDIQRVTDPSDIKRNRGDRNTVRTYFASNDDFSREGLKDVEFKRGDRNTSLDLSKINRREERSEIRKTDVRNNERQDRNDERKVVRENNNERKIERNTEKNNGRRDTRNDNSNDRREEVKIEKRNEERIQQRKERRNEERVEQKNENRNEQRNSRQRETRNSDRSR